MSNEDLFVHTDTTGNPINYSVIPYDTRKHRDSIPGDHFWFTATILGVNGLLISNAAHVRLLWPAALWIGFLNLYSIFLILHRSASHAGKLLLPANLVDKAQKDRSFQDKAAETRLNIRTTIRHIPFVVGECSGALFYVLLIVTSYFGVLVVQIL